MLVNSLYYLVKPVIPRPLQLVIRRMRVEYLLDVYKDVWPIDPESARVPYEWSGWPERKKFALVLTHDVEWYGGQNKCTEVYRVEKNNGFSSAFYFVPERYSVSSDLRNYLVQNGFEVGVHDLNHDGRLFSSRKVFLKRAPRINKYLRQWNSSGFRAGAMHHNLKWISELDVEYDCSTFDTDPFEPQPDGVGTIFPFWVSNDENERGYVEMPYTMPQDFTLFVIMRQDTIDVWKRKLDWIASKGGMVLINTHPDYMNTGDGECKREQYPIEIYCQFLEYVKKNYDGEYWNALPKEVASYISANRNTGIRVEKEG